MDFFGSPPKVTRSEYHKIRNILRGRGLSDYDIQDIDELFKEAFDAEDHSLSAKEIKEGITRLRKNQTKHHLSYDQINALEEELNKML